ncbi:MAG: hypothetical protein QM731_17855 [Chitinophagaceae bacterium]
MRILLLSDAPMALQAGGIGQTLYNIFSFVPPAHFMAIAPVEELLTYPPSEPYKDRYVSYKSRYLDVPRNRVGKFLTPFVNWINLSVAQLRMHKKIRKAIEQFAPDIIISCPNSVIGVLMHQKLLSEKEVKIPIVPYFMDDWMYNRKDKWIGANLQRSVGRMLRDNKNWMMISKELDELLRERYDLQPSSVLYIRNPVDISNAPEDTIYTKGSSFEIAYAGALWEMHYDSFYAVAKAVRLLQDSGIAVKLVLYSAENFWSWRKSELEILGVEYRGHIQYSDVHKTLHKADALLLTSSFSTTVYTHSKASLQTKITDYCKAKRLIVSCGPDYSANHKFLKQHECGVCIETNDPAGIAKELEVVISDIEKYQQLVVNGWNVLKSDFSKDIIHRRTQDFLQKA